MKLIPCMISLTLALLFASCGSKKKHQIIETGYYTMADEEFVNYSVNSEYTISVPSFLMVRNQNPERFSLVVEYTDTECWEDISFWSVLVESDDRETYEARRKKEGNLDKYPFTLKGLLEVALENGEGASKIKLIGSPVEYEVNNMPAISQKYKITIDAKITKIHCLAYLTQIQADNGEIYRIIVYYPNDEYNHDTEIPDWVAEVSNSFRLVLHSFPPANK